MLGLGLPTDTEEAREVQPGSAFRKAEAQRHLFTHPLARAELVGMERKDDLGDYMGSQSPRAG